jgi:hypothetical protein
MAKVEDFVTTVAEIERLTGLDMPVLREADLRLGGVQPGHEPGEISLVRRARRAPKPKGSAAGGTAGNGRGRGGASRSRGAWLAVPRGSHTSIFVGGSAPTLNVPCR